MASNSRTNTESSDFREEKRVKMAKKKLLLRIDPKLHDELRKWADDDFRSINAPVSYTHLTLPTKRIV